MTARAARIISLEVLRTDLRQVFRQICNAPGFTIAVILVLACGFAVSTAIFSAVRSVLLAPLPYNNPERLVQIVSQLPKTADNNGWTAPLGDLPELKSSVAAFQDLAAYRYSLVNLTTGSEARIHLRCAHHRQSSADAGRSSTIRQLDPGGKRSPWQHPHPSAE